MKIKKVILGTSLFVLAANSANAKSVQQQIDELRKQLETLQQKQTVNETNNQNQNANVEIGSKGLIVTSPDKQYAFKINGFAQLQSRNYFSPANGEVDQFLVRAARINFDSQFPGNFSSRIAGEFGSSSTTSSPKLSDAYLAWKGSDKFNAKIGKFKGPIGLERKQGDTDVVFVERGLIANLVPAREIGLEFSGKIIPQVEYNLLYSNGQADLGDANSDSGNGKDFSARIFSTPFSKSEIKSLKGLGIGLAGSFGDRNGNSTTSELPSAYKTIAQNDFFKYNSGVFADGKSSRINPQAYYYNGSFGSMAEYIISSNEVSVSGNKKALRNKAWSTTLSYVLTGEEASYNGVKPKNNFNPDEGKWGAFEVAARFGKLEFDKNTFPTFADKTKSPSSIEEKTIGLNWYFNQNVRMSFNFSDNNFKNGAVNGSRKNERSVLSLLQFKI